MLSISLDLSPRPILQNLLVRRDGQPLPLQSQMQDDKGRLLPGAFRTTTRAALEALTCRWRY